MENFSDEMQQTFRNMGRFARHMWLDTNINWRPEDLLSEMLCGVFPDFVNPKESEQLAEEILKTL